MWLLRTVCHLFLFLLCLQLVLRCLLFSLPFIEGSLGIFNSTTISDHCFKPSLQFTIFHRCSILQQIPFEFDAHIDSIQSSRHSHQQFWWDFFAAAYTRVIGEFDHLWQCAIQRTRDSYSTWLSVLPLQSHHYRVTIFICLCKNFGMSLLCAVGSFFEFTSIL